MKTINRRNRHERERHARAAANKDQPRASRQALDFSLYLEAASLLLRARRMRPGLPDLNWR